jgi:hypothetical protein
MAQVDPAAAPEAPVAREVPGVPAGLEVAGQAAEAAKTRVFRDCVARGSGMGPRALICQTPPGQASRIFGRLS